MVSYIWLHGHQIRFDDREVMVIDGKYESRICGSVDQSQ